MTYLHLSKPLKCLLQLLPLWVQMFVLMTYKIVLQIHVRQDKMLQWQRLSWVGGSTLAPLSVIISKLAACVNFPWLYKLQGVRGCQRSEADEGYGGLNQALRASCHRRRVQSAPAAAHLDGDTVQTLHLALKVLRFNTCS